MQQRSLSLGKGLMLTKTMAQTGRHFRLLYIDKPQSGFARLWLVESVCSYGGLQGTGNRDYCAVATQGVSKRNPCWPGWRPAGGRGQCVYACHRVLESSMAQTDASDY